MNKSASTEVLKLTEDLRWSLPTNMRDQWVEQIYEEAANLAGRHVTRSGESSRESWQKKLDWLLTSRWTGMLVMMKLQRSGPASWRGGTDRHGRSRENSMLFQTLVE